MYEFSAKGFRGFHDLDYVKIRPITLLIGENSAGKSSMLSGLKYLFDFISGNEEPTFNKDPFQLGTFQQIAHYRGGSAGRAREFNLRLRAQTRRQGRRKTSEHSLEEVEFEIRFVNTESQATIESIDITCGGETIRARIESDQLRLFYISAYREEYALEHDSIFPRVLRTEFARYWPFLLRDLRFRIRRERNENQRQLFSPDIEDRTINIAEMADNFARQMSGYVEATSAIRTKPLRTYTPGQETHDGEGSHVPFELAKLYRARNKEPWRRLKIAIENYGDLSEMFKQINIKSFGNTASDPFQIQFSNDGPKMNIVDLGYGTSQILPILYIISIASKKSKFLIQQPEVHLHPKAQAALGTYFVDSYVSDQKEFILETHSDFIVDRIRNAVSVGKISPDDVSILFFERKRLENSVTQIEIDENGSPISPPGSYRSFFMDEQMKILGLQ